MACDVTSVDIEVASADDESDLGKENHLPDVVVTSEDFPKPTENAVPLASPEDASDSSNCCCEEHEVNLRRRRGPASRLFGSFRKLIRRTAERASFRSPKGKRYNVMKKTIERGNIEAEDENDKDFVPQIKRRHSFESDMTFNISDNNDTQSEISTRSALEMSTHSPRGLQRPRDFLKAKARGQNPFLAEFERLEDEYSLSSQDADLMRNFKDSSCSDTNSNPDSTAGDLPRSRPPRPGSAYIDPRHSSISALRGRHKQVAFVGDSKNHRPRVALRYSSSMSEADSHSSSGSGPRDSISSSGTSDTSLPSIDKSAHPLSRRIADDNLSVNSSPELTPERPRNSSRQTRLQSKTESFRRVLPAYSINKDSGYRVGFAPQTWEVMKQGFRVALGGESAFMCDHFLGKNTALGVARELRWMKNTGLFDRHMSRDSKKPSFKYACVFLLEQESCHSHVDTLVLMLYKLALYYCGGWTKVSVEISYYPRGHNTQRIPQQGDDKRLLKCVYFPQVPLYTSTDANPSGLDVMSSGGVLNVATPSGDLRVEPELDRLVAFWGDSYEHTVSATRGETYCITVWLQR